MTYLQGLAEGIKLGILTREEAKIRLDAHLQKMSDNTEAPYASPTSIFGAAPNYYVNPRRAICRKEDNVYWLF